MGRAEGVEVWQQGRGGVLALLACPAHELVSEIPESLEGHRVAFSRPERAQVQWKKNVSMIKFCNYLISPGVHLLSRWRELCNSGSLQLPDTKNTRPSRRLVS